MALASLGPISLDSWPPSLELFDRILGAALAALQGRSRDGARATRGQTPPFVLAHNR